MKLGRYVSVYLCSLLLTAAAATAQPVHDTAEFGEVLWELADRYEHRELVEASSGDYESMKLVDRGYSGMPALRRYAVLSYEQRHIEKILRATLTTTYTAAAPEPCDPYQESSLHGETASLVRRNARILDHDAMRCWKERDYDGALRRVAGIIRLGNLLTGSEDGISVLSGVSLLDMAANRLAAIVETAEAADSPPTFSRSAVEEVRIELATRTEADPGKYAAQIASSSRRHLIWMRKTFLHEDGAEYYKDYLQHYGESEEDIVRRDALTRVTFDQALREAAAEGDGLDGWLDRTQELWDRLDPETQEAELKASRLRLKNGEVAWAGFLPRIYQNEPAQSPDAEQLRILFDQIESKIDELTAADTREDIRRALIELNDAIEQDRSQATRIAMQLVGAAGLTNWTATTTRHDESLTALDALERFIVDN